MKKPCGSPADELDPLMLLNIWAHHIGARQGKKMIFAGLGRPTYLLNPEIAKTAKNYWKELEKRSLKAARITLHLSPERACDSIVGASSAIDYGLPSGNPIANNLMAEAMTRWYGTEIRPRNLIFTVGGSSALRMIFKMIQGTIVTPSPFYPFYNDTQHGNTFHFINLFPGFRLTADHLKKTLLEVKNLSAFLFCDPNNPLGTVVGESEWKKLSAVLRTMPESPIILDESYAELTFHGPHTSLLKVAPDLKERLIVIRSATKGFSASGERMAVILCFNEKWRQTLLDETVFSYAHAPISLQLAYAHAMLNFHENSRKELSNHYHIQVKLVQERLKKSNALAFDYEVEGGFYAIANLRSLFGAQIPEEAAEVLSRTGKITTDEELCYSLLFKERVMVSPLSYFGLDPALGFVRITCSGGIAELNELLSRLLPFH